MGSCAFGWQDPQEKNGPRPYAHPPDVSNARYGPHERNVLDLWKAKAGHPTPIVVYIHGGGFTAGDKTGVPQPLLSECLKAGISVATINYRYSTIAPYPAPMEDGAHAVQFIRLHAKEWNIDPKAMACSGGSAGAGISLWIGFHDDMAQPSSDDPVKRQSTRLSVVGVNNAQLSYDPRFIAKLIDEPTGRHPALAKLFGVPEGQDVMKATDKFKEYEAGAPITHLNAGDPPVFLYYSRELHLPPSNLGEGIHSPQFGLYLKERMDKLGIECVVRTPKDYNAGPNPPQAYKEMVAFFQKYFPK
jgi:acetyl esterase